MDHFPSSHHVSKGKNFQKIYNIDSSWKKEVKKVFEKGSLMYRRQLGDNLWALDEVYSSGILKDFMDTSSNKVHLMKGFWSDWHPRRICRSRDNGYNKDLLQNGEYTELHSPRPYNEEGNKAFIDTLIKDLLSNE